MIIDGHTHIGKDIINEYLNATPKGQTPKELLKKMSENGVDKSIIFPFPAPVYFDPTSCKYLDKPLQPSERDVHPYNKENLEVLKAAKEHPDKFIPFLAVYPHNYSHALEIKYLARRNEEIKGLKFHGWTTHTQTTDLIDSKVMEAAEDNNLAVLVHSEASDKWDGYGKLYSNPMHAVKLAKAYPGVNIIVAHMGGLNVDFMDELASQKNLFTDTGPFLYIYDKIRNANSYKHRDINDIKPEQLLEELDKQFPRKIIWSTDEPWTVLNGNYETEVKNLRNLPEPVVHRIAEENISKVLGL